MLHEDQKYIDGLVQEDSGIMAEIFQKYGPYCKQFVLRNNGNAEDSADVFQESLLTVLKQAKMNKLELKVPFGGYFYIIYRNIWLGKLRKRKKEQLRIQDLKQYNSNNTAEEMAKEIELTNKRTEMLYECMGQLDEPCKKLMGGKLKKKTGKELMELLKLPTVNAVHFRMFKCREKLRILIEKHPDFIESF